MVKGSVGEGALRHLSSSVKNLWTLFARLLQDPYSVLQ